MEEKLIFKLTHENAQVPRRASKGAAGYDIYAAEHRVIPARGMGVVKTGVKVESIPTGLYGRIAPRSSLALKYCIDVGAGVIDNDYRGEICIILFNFSDADYNVSVGERVAQLILEKYHAAEVEITSLDDVNPTERGTGGFGSTGTHEIKAEPKI